MHYGTALLMPAKLLEIVRLSKMQLVQGRRHEVFIGGRIRGHRNPPAAKIYFLLGFRPL